MSDAFATAMPAATARSQKPVSRAVSDYTASPAPLVQAESSAISRSSIGIIWCSAAADRQ
jgi:hypothetical protein